MSITHYSGHRQEVLSLMLVLMTMMMTITTTTAFSHTRNGIRPITARFQQTRVSVVGVRGHASTTSLRAGDTNNDSDDDWLDGASVGKGGRGRSLKKPIEEQTIEELVEQAAREQQEQSDAEKEAAVEKKRDVLKRRSDKEYEAYWQRQTQPPPGGEKALMRAYYSLQKNESLSDKVSNTRWCDSHFCTLILITTLYLCVLSPYSHHTYTHSQTPTLPPTSGWWIGWHHCRGTTRTIGSRCTCPCRAR